MDIDSIPTFRGRPGLTIPTPASERKSTNFCFIPTLAVAVLISLPFLIYTLTLTDLSRFEWPFFKEDLTAIYDDVVKAWYLLVATFLVGLLLNVLSIVLLRYCTAFLVWFIIFVSYACLIAATIYMWIKYSKTTENGGELVFAIILSILLFLVTLLLASILTKISLVIRLIREAMKIIFAMPMLTFQTFITFIAYCIQLGATITFIICIITPADKHLSWIAIVTLALELFLAIWFEQIITGCQYLIISGAVSDYYFTRDKSTITAMGPIGRSTKNCIRFHLGTVICGSLIITLVQILLAILRSCTENKAMKEACEALTQFVKSVLNFLTKNAYYIVAMHGQGFIKSGKRAVQLLAANALSAIVANTVGNMILAAVSIGVGVLTGLFAFALDNGSDKYWAVIVIGVCFTLVLGGCFYTALDVTVFTLFLCFCEDALMNDGVKNPYYASVEFTHYVEEAKKMEQPPIVLPSA